MNKTSIIKGCLELCVLSIIQSKETYGYEIMSELEKHNLKLSGEGSIYPILTKLKERGLLEMKKQEGDRGITRIYYLLNDEGKAYLEREVLQWLDIQRDIVHLLRSHDRITEEVVL